MADAKETVSIEELEDQELAADLVLGGDEGKECTYSKKGYMKRQAIFSCLTCTPEGNAGVCTACSAFCHGGHKVVELWTKRNFKCDCGNSKFGEFYCKLQARKDKTNPENSYNQNFKGYYCTCNGPYPNLDTEDQVDMIQCCICEDWLHETHLGFESIDKIPRYGEDELPYEDFICQACAKKCAFLALYPSATWAPAGQCEALQNSGKEENVLGSSLMVENAVVSSEAPVVASATTNVAPELKSGGKVGETNMPASDSSSKDPIVAGFTDVAPELNSGRKVGEKSKRNMRDTDSSSKDPIVARVTDVAPELKSSGKVGVNEGKSKRKGTGSSSFSFFVQRLDGSENNFHLGSLLESGGKPVLSEEKPETEGSKDSSFKCILEEDPNTTSLENAKPMFLPKNWRESLCKCGRCLVVYKEKGISFLIDPADSIAEYQKMAAKKREKLQQKEEAQLDFFSKLSDAHYAKIIGGITDMKAELQSFLANTDTSKPVTAADVEGIFTKLAKRPRQ